ncbi:MAG TPA: ParB/RepB/Spo0J family partition protein [Patescibacteria group bacterium]
MSTVTQLPIDQLQPNPFQPREKIKRESLEELSQSIKTYGILEPLVVAETPAGYQIIAGERRWRAAKEAGLTDVPVHIKKTTPRGMLEMALVENVQRSDLNALERAQAFQQLMRDFQFTPSQLAERVGKSAAYISNHVRLLQLPDAVKDGLIGGLITEGHARALTGLFENEEVLISCYKTILKESASVRRAEELVRHYKEQHQIKTPPQGRPLQIADSVVNDLQKKLQLKFHTKPKLKLVRSQRQTRISITLAGTPEQTQADFEKLIESIT